MSLKRTKSKKSKLCEQYRTSRGHDRCEVTHWILPDRDAAKWIAGHGWHEIAVHHLFGRGKSYGFEWRCNLIQMAKSSHEWLHDYRPACGELAALRAKMACEQDRIRKKINLPIDNSLWEWHPNVMALLIGRDSLAGRVDELMHREGVEGTVFHGYGTELLAFLGS